MKTLKYKIFGILLFELLEIHGQTKDKIINQIQNSIDIINNFEIEYLYYYKSQTSNDTIKEVINSKFVTQNGNPKFGYINQIRTNSKKFDIAFIPEYLIYLDRGQNQYFKFDSKDNYSGYRKKIFENFYRPFTYKSDFYNNYSLNNSNKKYYLFTRIDSGNHNNLKTFTKIKSVIKISKFNNLPISEEEWIWYEGGVQYTKFELIKLKKDKEKDSLKTKSETIKLINKYKSSLNGDSVYLELMSHFKQLKVGDSIVNFVGHLHGSDDSIEINKLKDSIIILDFSYTTCGPCAAAVPKLNKIFMDYKERGVSLYSINPYKNDWPKLDKFISYFEVKFPVLEVDYNISLLYGVDRYPTLIIIKNGIVKYIKGGSSEKLEEIIRRELDKII